MQGLLGGAALSQAAGHAAVTARAAGTAAFRPATQKQQRSSAKDLSHKARAFAGATAEAPTTQKLPVSAAPSM